MLPVCSSPELQLPSKACKLTLLHGKNPKTRRLVKGDIGSPAAEVQVKTKLEPLCQLILQFPSAFMQQLPDAAPRPKQVPSESVQW